MQAYAATFILFLALNAHALIGAEALEVLSPLAGQTTSIVTLRYAKTSCVSLLKSKTEVRSIFGVVKEVVEKSLFGPYAVIETDFGVHKVRLSKIQTMSIERRTSQTMTTTDRELLKQLEHARYEGLDVYFENENNINSVADYPPDAFLPHYSGRVKSIRKSVNGHATIIRIVEDCKDTGCSTHQIYLHDIKPYSLRVY